MIFALFMIFFYYFADYKMTTETVYDSDNSDNTVDSNFQLTECEKEQNFTYQFEVSI